MNIPIRQRFVISESSSGLSFIPPDTHSSITPMYEYWLETADPAVVEAYKASLKQQFPIDGDMGDVDRDLVPVMVFLASEASRFINGQVICVNGGLAMVR